MLPTNFDESEGSDVSVARERVARLFRFVSEMYNRRNPAQRQVGDSWTLKLSDLPDTDTIQVMTPAQVQDEVESESEAPILLRCRRPNYTSPPPAPETLKEWLHADWNDCQSKPSVASTRNIRDPLGATIVERFDDVAERQAALIHYREIWETWAKAERVAVAAGDVFERLYSLRGTLERDGERFELGIADGTLVWARDDGGVRHPLLFRPARLEFDASLPEFRIVETGAPTEFYSSLFRSMREIDGIVIGKLRTDAEEMDLHPLGGADVSGFLRGVASSLSSRGTFREDEPVGPERPDPTIGRGPLFIVRKRTSGLSRAIDFVVEATLSGAELPRALFNVVGKPREESNPSNPSVDVIGGMSHPTDANEDSEVLFTKPANAEQLNIARLLDRNDCVLVQGPPGTGKTHTIANLLGHLLAQGKRVLVLSHTTKALKVLRSKVVEELQPLCVSVLDSVEDDATLKTSVEGIVARIGSASAGLLDREIAEFKVKRDALIDEVSRLRAAVIDARMNEVRSIVVGGSSIMPIEAAKVVADGAGIEDWIPSGVTLGEPPPLTVSELYELYKTNESVTVDDEAKLRTPLPDIQQIFTPDNFAELLARRRRLESADREHAPELWRPESRSQAGSLDETFQTVWSAVSALDQKPQWALRLVADSMLSPIAQKAWQSLLDEVELVRSAALEAAELIASHQPRPAPNADLTRNAEIYSELAHETRQTGKPPSFLTLLAHRSWKEAIEQGSIGGGARPRLPEHFEALDAMASLQKRRAELCRRWDAQVAAIGGPSSDPTGTEPEALLARFLPLLRAALAWHAEVWSSAQSDLETAGFKWRVCKALADARYVDDDELGRLQRIAKDILPVAFASERSRREWAEIEQEINAGEAIASRWPPSEQVIALREAIRTKRPESYRREYDDVLRLVALRRDLELRSALLTRLDRVAASWAAKIRGRIGAHGEATPPGDFLTAWWWRQLSDELSNRDRISLPEITSSLEMKRNELREVTASLVDRQAWRAQLERTTPEQRMALMTFVDAKRRIGRGTGKRAATFAKVARKALTDAQSAVPVWIMPIVKAAEMFDPRSVKFDVVIVDESSQSDTTGLLAFFLGRQIIVVGDDEQVSPSAVGEQVEDAQHLIDEFLQGIPAKDLFDGKQSLYDIAKRAFGGTARLLEHFRCVPDIIRFSNHLSYEGSIKPLREAKPEDPTPSVVAHRVSSRGANDKVNEDEAREVAALAAACVEQPEYSGKTFGVISLVGEEQARRIETILRLLLPPEEIESRRLLAGNASQFQGDERNVIFLSMVQSGQGVPLPLMQQKMFQQRFNVAASRAQDQMWVVHSLDHTAELKVGDLRRRLIEHALDPDALATNEAAAIARAESPFEVDVIQRLSNAGYSVTAQHWVGAYRIDIVVNGANRSRLAVECDGERYHRPEDIKNDADRQAILERVGWTFERIRGSQFYRNPELAMKPVFDRLALMGILPQDVRPTIHGGVAESDLVARVRARAAEILSGLGNAEPERQISNNRRRFNRAPISASEEPITGAASVRELPLLMQQINAKANKTQDRSPSASPSRAIAPESSKELGFYEGPLPTSQDMHAILAELAANGELAKIGDDLYALMRRRLLGKMWLRKHQRSEFDRTFQDAVRIIRKDGPVG